MNQGKMPNHARRTGPALKSMYRFTLWLVPTIEKFPRSQKFLVGDRIQSTALERTPGQRPSWLRKFRLRRQARA